MSRYDLTSCADHSWQPSARLQECRIHSVEASATGNTVRDYWFFLDDKILAMRLGIRPSRLAMEQHRLSLVYVKCPLTFMLTSFPMPRVDTA